jgi:inhibitor of KinA
MNVNHRIFPLGDSALTVELGSEISASVNQVAIALSEYLELHPFPGFVETVPAYASVTVFYDLAQVVVDERRGPGVPAFTVVKDAVENAIQSLDGGRTAEPSAIIEIPVFFDDVSALDLQAIAAHSGLSARDVIEIFTRGTYRVFMLGFLPGFTYMGEIDERIAMPRRDVPRKEVPKGSVAIAGRQAGVYSLASPGGWNVIGRTDVELFTPYDSRPTLLAPGDTVRFVVAQ